MTILDTILAHKRNEIEEAKKRVPLRVLEEQVRALSSGALGRPRFSEALRREDQVAIIAEIKKASPSKGLIRPDFDPVQLATIYAQEGAAAISVLTDERFFQGSLEHLAAVRRAVALPLLRKEFIIDEYQLYEAKAYGADAVLLIVAALEPERLERLYRASAALGLDSLIEVHTESELETALRLGASLVGINNRDLATFHTSLDVTARLIPYIPDHVTVVSESGISSREDIVYLRELGVDAVLIGEALTREPDVAAKLRSLAGEGPAA